MMEKKNLNIEFFTPRMEGRTVHVGPKPVVIETWESEMSARIEPPTEQMKQRVFDRLDREFKLSASDALNSRDNPSSPTGRIKDPYRPVLHNINMRPEQAAVLRHVTAPPRYMGGVPVELMCHTESSPNVRALFEMAQAHMRDGKPVVTIDSLPVEYVQKGDGSIVIADEPAHIGGERQALGRAFRIDYESRPDWSMNRTNRAATPAKNRTKLRAKGRAQKQARKRQRG